MLQYLIIVHDGKDKEALDRRMKVRPLHFEAAKELKRHNKFVTGGAILDDNGKMIGSKMVVQFDSEDGLVYWMSHEPYITGNVWQSIDVKPFKVADI